MDDAGEGDRLAIGGGVAHLAEERGQRGIVGHRVLGPVEHEQLRRDPPDGDFGRRLQHTVEADPGEQSRRSGAGEFEHDHATKAKADRGDPAVAARMGGERGQRGGGAGVERRRVVAQAADPAQSLPEIRWVRPLAIDVGGERHIAELSGDAVGPAARMGGDAVDVVEDDDAGPAVVAVRHGDGAVEGEIGCVIEAVGHGAVSGRAWPCLPLPTGRSTGSSAIARQSSRSGTVSTQSMSSRRGSTRRFVRPVLPPTRAAPLGGAAR